MLVVKSLPPNYRDILRAIPAAEKPGIIFTYGNTIFAPAGGEISPWIIAHEEVHAARQGGHPETWWASYLASPKFRFDEEVVAHRAEWHFWVQTAFRARHDRRAMMKIIAGRLSGPLYGRMCPIKMAVKLIKASPDEL